MDIWSQVERATAYKINDSIMITFCIKKFDAKLRCTESHGTQKGISFM